MNPIINIRDLTKRYGNFTLDHLNLSVPGGCVMGFIGENGAGKTTTIKLMLNLISRDEGEVKIFGLDNIRDEEEIKEQIGVVFDECRFPDLLKPGEIGKILQGTYKSWNQRAYMDYLNRFSLPAEKTIKEYSRGMKMKLCIAAALSHETKLLLLDEATSGLDPVVRDEVLDVFLDFIQDEEHTVFFSSHITSDLEKIADYVTFVHKGRIQFSDTKDNVLNEYGVLKCSLDQLSSMDKSKIVGYRKNQFGAEVLVHRAQIDERAYTVDPANLENIMLFYVKGEQK